MGYTVSMTTRWQGTFDTLGPAWDCPGLFQPALARLRKDAHPLATADAWSVTLSCCRVAKHLATKALLTE